MLVRRVFLSIMGITATDFDCSTEYGRFSTDPIGVHCPLWFRGAFRVEALASPALLLSLSLVLSASALTVGFSFVLPNAS